jgi:hypothetical protein
MHRALRQELDNGEWPKIEELDFNKPWQDENGVQKPGYVRIHFRTDHINNPDEFSEFCDELQKFDTGYDTAYFEFARAMVDVGAMPQPKWYPIWQAGAEGEQHPDLGHFHMLDSGDEGDLAFVSDPIPVVRLMDTYYQRHIPWFNIETAVADDIRKILVNLKNQQQTMPHYDGENVPYVACKIRNSRGNNWYTLRLEMKFQIFDNYTEYVQTMNVVRKMDEAWDWYSNRMKQTVDRFIQQPEFQQQYIVQDNKSKPDINNPNWAKAPLFHPEQEFPPPKVDPGSQPYR